MIAVHTETERRLIGLPEIAETQQVKVVACSLELHKNVHIVRFITFFPIYFYVLELERHLEHLCEEFVRALHQLSGRDSIITESFQYVVGEVSLEHHCLKISHDMLIIISMTVLQVQKDTS